MTTGITRLFFPGSCLDRYVVERQRQGAANGTIRIELALLGRAFTLAVRAKKLRTRPYVPVPAADPSRVRQGFLAREELEALAKGLPDDLADAVLFLFWSTWRPSEMRTLQWRDYDRTEQTIRLRPERSKNKYGRVLPVEGELAKIIERRWKARRLDCPYIFHRDGKPIGDFRKRWKRACAALGLDDRIVYDLRRSGVRHLIQSGVDPHTVMAFSGHRTASMLRRYHIIDVDDLRRAAERASTYCGQRRKVVPLTERTRRERAE